MTQLVFARRFLEGMGFLLLIVAGIHLLMTPAIREHVLGAALPPDARRVVEAPFLLNHVVVGILLIPIGLTTVYAARGIQSRERWAWLVCLFNGLSILSLPIVLLLVMRPEHFQALPFLLASVLITGVGIGMTAVLVWIRPVVRGPTDGIWPA